MDELTIGDKTYISSKRAAKITGYAKDYVGQLCREGRVEARFVGRNWYVLETSIREHRFGAAPAEVRVAKEESVEVRDEVLQREWTPAVYEAETPISVPALEAKAQTVTDTSEVINDMQSAWQEWFSAHEAVTPVQALPDGTADFKPEDLPVLIEEEEDEPVTITRISEYTPVHEEEQVYMESKEQSLEIHRSYAEDRENEVVPEHMTVMDLSSERQEITLPEKRSADTTHSIGSWSTAVFRIILVCTALTAISTALVGTGTVESIPGLGAPGSKLTTYLNGEWEYKSIK